MERKEKPAPVHFVLLGLTLAFFAALLILSRGAPAAREDGWSVQTQRALPEEAARQAEPLDINTATAEELETLNGIGPVLAQAIVDHRAAHGAFRSVDELLDVDGIGESKLAAIRADVAIGGEDR